MLDNTGWHEVDARPSAAELRQQSLAKQPPTPSQIEASESQRLTARDQAKTAHAIATQAVAEWESINATIAVVVERKENLASAHVTEAQPLQSRLAAIEAEQIAAIKSRKPTDAAIEAERTELLVKLRGMNADLQGAIEREDRIIGRLEDERFHVGLKSNISAPRNELIATASMPLQISLQLAVNTERWAQTRRNRAAEPYAASRQQFKRAELDLAAKLLAEAQQALTAAEEFCIDE